MRPWKRDDAKSLVLHANNYQIARNLRDGFPYPYTLRDAINWLDMVRENQEDVILAIEMKGEAVGGIGLHGMKDVYRYNAEIGYWLSEDYWGMGVITEAIGLIVEYGFTNRHWLRIFATVYEYNEASMRVLEKNHFVKEAVHKKTVMKEGVMLDEHLYALLRENWLNYKSSSNPS